MRSLKEKVIISKKTVVDQIIDLIINAVSTGKYPLGSRLPSEYELMEEFSVSRNSLREALKILASMGVIEIKRGNGTYVCSQIDPSPFDKMIYSMIFDISQVDELIELRRILDRSMIRLAMKNIDDSGLAELEENLAKMNLAILNKESAKAAKLDYEFHMIILKNVNNVFLQRITKGVYSLYFDYIEDTLLSEKRESKAPIHHKAIIECLRSKNVNNIDSIVDESLISWIKKLDEVNNLVK